MTSSIRRTQGALLSALLWALLAGGCSTAARHDHSSQSGQELPHDERTQIVRIPADAARPDPAKSPPLDRAESLIVDRTNTFRREQGRPAVAADESLARAAREFAQFMARTDKYGHAADGRQPADRAKAAGYDYCLVSENIAYQFSSEGYDLDGLVHGFVQGWIDSPGHRRNMVDPDVVHTGVAVARNADGVYYAVQLFGRPESMRVDFKVANRTDRAVRYTLDDKSYDLPPRAIRTHGVCRPPTLKIETGAPDAETLRPSDGAVFTVVEGRNGVRVQRSK
jgi:uncharacterized protein YkwD